jgi:transcriptional regulator with XRE-family HTH domain
VNADHIGRRIRAARVYAGHDSRKDFAGLIELSEPTLQRMEQGERSPKRSELLAIAEVCQVPIWFLESGWGGWRASSDDP